MKKLGLNNADLEVALQAAPHGYFIRESGTSNILIAFIAKVNPFGSSVVTTYFDYVSTLGAYVPGTNLYDQKLYDLVFFNPNLYPSYIQGKPSDGIGGANYRWGDIGGNVDEGTSRTLANIDITTLQFDLVVDTFNYATNTSNITLKVVGIDPQSGFTNADGDVIAANETFYKNLKYQTLGGVDTGLIIPNKKRWLTSDGVVDVTAYIPYIAKTTNAVNQTNAPSISTTVIDTSTTAITGTSEANAVVKLYAGGTSLLQTVNANAAGGWSATIAAQILNTSISATAQSTGKSLSLPSPSIIVTALGAVQTATPVITSLINNSTTAIYGTSEANSTVTILFGSNLLTTVTANSSGNWNATIAVQNAGNSITAKAQAPGKTISVVSNPVVVTSITNNIISNPITYASSNNPFLGNTTTPTTSKKKGLAWWLYLIFGVGFLLAAIVFFTSKTLKKAIVFIVLAVLGFIGFFLENKKLDN